MFTSGASTVKKYMTIKVIEILLTLNNYVKIIAVRERLRVNSSTDISLTTVSASI